MFWTEVVFIYAFHWWNFEICSDIGKVLKYLEREFSRTQDPFFSSLEVIHEEPEVREDQLK